MKETEEKKKKYKVKEDKTLQKVNDNSGKRVVIRLSNEEKSLLDMMMKEEEWNNTSGFIKYKIFGMDSEARFQKRLKTSEKEDIEIILKNLLETFHKDTVYISMKYDNQLKALEEEVPKEEMKSKFINKWASLLRDYYLRMNENIGQMNQMYYDLLKPLGIYALNEIPSLEGKARENFIRCIPDEILEEYVRNNWQDTSSDLMKEHARRVIEARKKKD